MVDKIKNFTDLNTWKEAHKLVLQIYKITKFFPTTEKFALVDQILRAVVSITSNIAEGFGRQGLKEKIQFYYMAQASLAEVQNQLILAKDLGYLSKITFEQIWEQSVSVYKLISGLIRSIKNYS